MNRDERRAAGRASSRTARDWPARLEQVPRGAWPPLEPGHVPPLELWRSRRFLVMVYAEPQELGVTERITVTRTDREGGISWAELQAVTAEIGRGDRAAVELYPPESPPWAWGSATRGR